jgi:hypothetical protein
VRNALSLSRCAVSQAHMDALKMRQKEKAKPAGGKNGKAAA